VKDIRLEDLVSHSVERFPNLPALEVAGLCLTYAELWGAAGVLADRIAFTLGTAPGRLAVSASRDALSYVSYLAVLRAGATVVPLNPDVPAVRNLTVARAAGVRAVIARPDSQLIDICVSQIPRCAAIPADLEALIAGNTSAIPEVNSAPAAELEAYILFTSGATGRPKGVPIRHSNVVGYIQDQAGLHGAGPGKRFSQTFDLTFDPSVFDMFVAWSAGGTVVTPTREEILDPVAFVNASSITHWFSVPSVISLAKRTRRLPPDSMPTLEWSLFAGEQLPVQLARAWHRAAPQAIVENLYGPTEVTITCTAFQLPKSVEKWPSTKNGTVPIGTPHRGLEIVIDDAGSPGTKGELCVRGRQRLAGYLSPSDDQGRFVRVDGAKGIAPTSPSAPDGYYRTGDIVSLDPAGFLVHQGRVDSQRKIHGYRVELGEIESAIRGLSGMDDVVVVMPNEHDLIGCYTGVPIGREALVDHLRSQLPWYMVPTHFRHFDTFPMSDNGKIDRRALASAVLRQSAAADL
jgi:amino acid adenylation domain-containing protein